jgi:hypothetical protein
MALEWWPSEQNDGPMNCASSQIRQMFKPVWGSLLFSPLGVVSLAAASDRLNAPGVIRLHSTGRTIDRRARW